MHKCSQLRLNEALPSCFSSHAKDKYLFVVCLCHIFHSFKLLMVISLFKMPHSAEVLSVAPKCKKAAICLIENLGC